MIVCDRCGNKIIKRKDDDDDKKIVTIYRTQDAYIGHYVDCAINVTENLKNI